MADIIKLTVVLTIVSLTAALAIAFTNSKTKDRILEQNQIAEKSALEQIMPQNSEITEMHCSTAGCPSQYWIAKNENQTAYAFKISSRGYAGDIHYLVSVTEDGKIMGMSILEQSETPGLGARVSESISKKYIWNGLFGKKRKVFGGSPNNSKELISIKRLQLIKQLASGINWTIINAVNFYHRTV